MKKIIFLFLFPTLLFAQNYISLSIGNGYMINADKGMFKMGLGGAFTYLLENNIPLGSCNNFITFTIDGIDYPHVGENYILKHFNDGINNAFHYCKLLIGYRIGLRIPEQSGSYMYYRDWHKVEGLSFEPTIGIGINNIRLDNNIVLISPRINYVRNHMQISIYSDYGQSKYHNGVGYSTIWSIGCLMGIIF